MAAKWSKEALQARLKEGGHDVLLERAIDHGLQLTLSEGTVICLYNTGKIVVQGKANEEKAAVEVLLAGPVPKNVVAPSQTVPSVGPLVPSTKAPVAADGAPAAYGAGADEDPRVFIVYGHDKQSREALELMLLRLDIKPVILSQMVPNGNTIIEALTEHSEVKCAIVLLTPDDEGHPTGVPDKKKARARQNVVLELGMFLTKLGRKRVIILHKGDLELPSDIHGLIYLPYNRDIQEVKNKVGAALQKMGFPIDIEKLSAE